MAEILYPVRQTSNLEVHAHCYWSACRSLRHGDALFAMGTLDLLRQASSPQIRERAEARLLTAGAVEPATVTPGPEAA